MEEVNLDLNFGGPDLETEVSLEPNVAEVLSDVANEPFNRDSESLRRFRTRLRSSFRRNNSLPASHLIISSANGADLTASGERESEEDSNKCENGRSKVMEEEDSVREEKSVGSKESFYDCYICMDLSKEPVVTNCGHLYCWPCLYRWLEVSVAKECPVCKGEISVKTLTPIYGRGGKIKGGSEEVSVSDTTNKKKKIPSRPQARRVERVRRSTLQRPGYVGSEIINRFMPWRRVRAESSAAVVAPVYEEGSETMRSSRAMSIWRGRTARNQERNNVASVEDRDSVSSILGVMNSESQADTAAEIDSMVTVSNSSVGRPHENGSRVSDVDIALAEWLRRVPAKYMGFSRESSNISGDEVFFFLP
ncbi:unnamed protein product [Brassica rapa subsp. trilocularis]